MLVGRDHIAQVARHQGADVARQHLVGQGRGRGARGAELPAHDRDGRERRRQGKRAEQGERERRREDRGLLPQRRQESRPQQLRRVRAASSDRMAERSARRSARKRAQPAQSARCASTHARRLGQLPVEVGVDLRSISRWLIASFRCASAA